MKKLVKCPRCGKEVEYSTSNLFRPFCSERCQLIDLGQWAEGKYAIPTDEKVNPEPHSKDEDKDD
jgi:uncharacterized protein